MPKTNEKKSNRPNKNITTKDIKTRSLVQPVRCKLSNKQEGSLRVVRSEAPCAAHDGGRLPCPRLAVAEKTGVEALRGLGDGRQAGAPRKMCGNN